MSVKPAKVSSAARFRDCDSQSFPANLHTTQYTLWWLGCVTAATSCRRVWGTAGRAPASERDAEIKQPNGAMRSSVAGLRQARPAANSRRGQAGTKCPPLPSPVSLNKTFLQTAAFLPELHTPSSSAAVKKVRAAGNQTHAPTVLLRLQRRSRHTPSSPSTCSLSVSVCVPFHGGRGGLEGTDTPPPPSPHLSISPVLISGSN